MTLARSPNRLETGGVTRGAPRCPTGGAGATEAVFGGSPAPAGLLVGAGDDCAGRLSRPGSGGGVGFLDRGAALGSRSASERLGVTLARSPDRLEIVADELFDITTSYYLILPETRASASAVQAFAKWLTAEVRIFNARSGRRVAGKKPAERRPDGANKINKVLIEAADFFDHTATLTIAFVIAI